MTSPTIDEYSKELRKQLKELQELEKRLVDGPRKQIREEIAGAGRLIKGISYCTDTEAIAYAYNWIIGAISTYLNGVSGNPQTIIIPDSVYSKDIRESAKLLGIPLASEMSFAPQSGTKEFIIGDLPMSEKATEYKTALLLSLPGIAYALGKYRECYDERFKQAMEAMSKLDALCQSLMSFNKA